MRNAEICLKDGDYAGALKYSQEASEYAVKAVLIAYGLDYPKVHAVGSLILDLALPDWFEKEAKSIAETADWLAGNRAKFRYSYEYPPEDFELQARELVPAVRRSFDLCKKLVEELFV